MDWKSLKKGDKIVESAYMMAINSTIITDPVVDEEGLVHFQAETLKGQVIEYIGGGMFSPNIEFQVEVTPGD